MVVRLALDTGATASLINTDLLASLGYESSLDSPHINITTGSAIVSVTETVLDQIDALGRTIHGFQVVSHTLPETAGVDGLLGLDFFRGSRLVLDFRTGRLTLD